MIKLRDYQKEAHNAVWNDITQGDSALCVISTGGGKTEVMMELLRTAITIKPDIKIAVLVNKVQLLDQTERRFSKVFPVEQIGVYCGTSKRKELDKKITIASIQSIHKIHMDQLNLLVLDESHNVNEVDGRYIDFIEKHRVTNPKLKIIAFTATPFKATGYIYGEDKIFKKISFRKGLVEMISEGHLVPPRMKKVDHQFDTSKLQVRMGEFVQEQVDELTQDVEKIRVQVKHALEQMTGRKKAVWACSSIQHCEMVKEELLINDETATAVHSKMDKDHRAHAMFRFENGHARHLVFVTIVSEGYDHPPIDCIVLMRPTRSPVLYVQTVGRGLRLAPGKSNCLVLDFGRVVETLGPLDDPMVPREGQKKKDLKPIPMKFCPECLEYLGIKTLECPVCGHIFEVAKRDPVKNLTHKTSLGDILSQANQPPAKKVMSPDKAELSSYMSKAGNRCLVITYTSYKESLIMPTIIKEYFIWGKDYAHKAMAKRFQDLDVDLRGGLEEQATARVRILPTTVEYIIKADGHPAVTRVVVPPKKSWFDMSIGDAAL